MNGKKQFKTVRDDHLDSIMKLYNVSKDTAYQALAKAFCTPCVCDAISKAVAEQLCKGKSTNQLEELVSQFFNDVNIRR